MPYCTFARWMFYKNLSYKDKLLWSEQLILFALKSNKAPAVSLSWGKDSVVMLHLIRKYCKNTHIIFANTGIEYPETYKYRDEMLKTKFFGDMKYVETKPIKTFWQCVKEYGYPTKRKEKGRGSNQPMCCIYLKEKPLRDKQKELGVDLVFMGLQGTESMNRRRLFMRLGGYYRKKTEGLNICLPLAIWTDDNIKKYIDENKIPMNPLYNQMNRTGCMYCTGFKNWEKVLAKYNFKAFRVFNKNKTGQTTLDDHDCFKEE